MAKSIVHEHPGRRLKRQLKLVEVSAKKLAAAMRISQRRVSKVLKGKKPITADHALRLARFLGTSAREWLSEQVEWDIAEAERRHGKEIAGISQHARTAVMPAAAGAANGKKKKKKAALVKKSARERSRSKASAGAVPAAAAPPSESAGASH